MKKFMAVLLCSFMALALVACGNKTDSPANGGENLDAVTTPSVSTNMYTNLDQAALLKEIGKYSGVTVVSTVNADGTPNIAILTPGVADENHIVFNLAPTNATMTNLKRDKVAKMVFDKPNTAAETKEERHQGAVVRLELEEDTAVLDELKANNEYITDSSLVCKLVEVLPVG